MFMVVGWNFKGYWGHLKVSINREVTRRKQLILSFVKSSREIVPTEAQMEYLFDL